MDYLVLQGIMKKTDTGDLLQIKRFNTLEEAKQFFNEIKEDVKNWNINRDEGDFLETWLIDQEDHIIELHRF